MIVTIINWVWKKPSFWFLPVCYKSYSKVIKNHQVGSLSTKRIAILIFWRNYALSLLSLYLSLSGIFTGVGNLHKTGFRLLWLILKDQASLSHFSGSYSRPSLFRNMASYSRGGWKPWQCCRFSWNNVHSRNQSVHSVSWEAVCHFHNFQGENDKCLPSTAPCCKTNKWIIAHLVGGDTNSPAEWKKTWGQCLGFV